MDDILFRLEKISKSFGDEVALCDIDLDIRKGEIFVLMGPSGSGKTTLLRIMNRLETPSNGSIFFQNRDMASLNNKESLVIIRKMAMVFQEGFVFNYTVLGNISYGLKVRGIEKDEISERVEKALELVGLSGYQNRNARSLSGGEKQRVTFAMAMVLNPEVLILDEPTANLDPINQEVMEDIIRKINKMGVTIVLSTHKQREAISLAHRIALINNGNIEQMGTPEEVFQKPKTEFVASFTRMKNIFYGTVKELNRKVGTAIIKVSELDVEVQWESNCEGFEGELKPGDAVKIGTRPENIMLIRKDMPLNPDRRNVFKGKIVHSHPLGGALMRLHVELGDLEVIIDIPRHLEKKMELYLNRDVILSLNKGSLILMEK